MVSLIDIDIYVMFCCDNRYIIGVCTVHFTVQIVLYDTTKVNEGWTDRLDSHIGLYCIRVKHGIHRSEVGRVCRQL